jgi:hypothetical protein
MQEITLNNDVKIYKTKFISPYVLADTLEKIKMNILLNKRTTDDRMHENVGPGIQSPIILKCPELDVILDNAVSVCKELYGEETYGHLMHSWVAISRNDRTKLLWHKHIHFAPPYNFIETDYTFTYYLQMPDNLSGDDGMLLFKTNDGQIHKFLPEENDMFIFPPDLEHVVEWNRDSTKDRVVVASNIKLINSNKTIKQCTPKIL